MIYKYMTFLKEIVTKKVDSYEDIINNICSLVVKLDKNGNIVYFNEKFKTLLCMQEDQIFLRKFSEFLGIKDLKDFNKYINLSKTNEICDLEISLYNKFEEKKYLNTHIKHLPLNDEFLLTFEDITVKKEEEIYLEKQRTKLAIESRVITVSEMLENIAHQWRQPLNVISISASGLHMNSEYNDVVEHDQIKEATEMIMKQCEYLTKTIDSFRNIYLLNSNNSQIHHLKAIIDKLLGLVKSSYELNGIKLNLSIDENIFIKIDETALFQAVINIFNNTKDIFLERKISKKDRYFIIKVTKFKNDVVLKFMDTAGGINENNLEKIFEPYFTTKHKAVGTGIGLHMTHQIITKHLNGTIEVKNKIKSINGKKYKGALFKITLPVND